MGRFCPSEPFVRLFRTKRAPSRRAVMPHARPDVTHTPDRIRRSNSPGRLVCQRPAAVPYGREQKGGGACFTTNNQHHILCIKGKHFLPNVVSHFGHNYTPGGRQSIPHTALGGEEGPSLSPVIKGDNAERLAGDTGPVTLTASRPTASASACRHATRRLGSGAFSALFPHPKAIVLILWAESKFVAMIQFMW